MVPNRLSFFRKGSFAKRLAIGLTVSVLCVLCAVVLGLIHEGLKATLWLIAISIILEAQPAAAASIPLGFHPFMGMAVSVVANLILIPIIILMFDELKRWRFVNRKLEHAGKWTTKYGRYGVWALTLLCPFLGAYVCLALGLALQWSQSRVLISIAIGMIVSSCIVAYGGHAGYELIRFGSLHHLLLLFTGHHIHHRRWV